MMLRATLLFLSVLFSVPSFATTAFTWNGQPLSIMLEIGKERIVRFPDNLQYRFPTEATKSVAMSTTAGILYITPKAELYDLPVDVRLVETGEVIQLRLTAVSQEQDLDDVRVTTVTEQHKKTEFNQSESSIGQNADFADSQEGDPIALVRFAGIRDMMPERLWFEDPSISEIPVPEMRLDNLFTGKLAGKFYAEAHKSYRSGNLVLTSIALRNMSPYPVAVDFRDIAVDNKYVVIPKPYYTFAGKDDINQNDYGVMYIITRGAFLPYLLQVDPFALAMTKGGNNE